jgi:hypothetical protein
LDFRLSGGNTNLGHYPAPCGLQADHVSQDDTVTDIFSREKRSQIMASIHGHDTTLERIVRSMAHRLGFRFRLHVRTLPGSPDIVFPKHRKIILVNGCF